MRYLTKGVIELQVHISKVVTWLPILLDAGEALLGLDPVQGGGYRTVGREFMLQIEQGGERKRASQSDQFPDHAAGHDISSERTLGDPSGQQSFQGDDQGP